MASVSLEPRVISLTKIKVDNLSKTGEKTQWWDQGNVSTTQRRFQNSEKLNESPQVAQGGASEEVTFIPTPHLSEGPGTQ